MSDIEFFTQDHKTFSGEVVKREWYKVPKVRINGDGKPVTEHTIELVDEACRQKHAKAYEAWKNPPKKEAAPIVKVESRSKVVGALAQSFKKPKDSEK